MCISYFQLRASCSANSIFLYFNSLTLLGEVYKLRSLIFYRLFLVGRHSSGGIATLYVLDGLGIEPRGGGGRDFPQPSRPALGKRISQNGGIGSMFHEMPGIY